MNPPSHPESMNALLREEALAPWKYALSTEFQYSSKDIFMLQPSVAAAWELVLRNRETFGVFVPLKMTKAPIYPI